MKRKHFIIFWASMYAAHLFLTIRDAMRGESFILPLVFALFSMSMFVLNIFLSDSFYKKNKQQ